MQLLSLGLNHASADIAVRERLAFAPEQLVAAHQDAQSLLGNVEVVLVSTCNRTEVVVAGDIEPDAIVRWLAAYHQLPVEAFSGHLYSSRGMEALQHLVEVASGLDSMVLGEPQIFGQLKSAFAVAREAGTVGAILEPAFQQVFAIAKRVRSGTAIGENPVSVAYAAVALSQRIFSNLTELSVLLIGAGETIELVGRHLVEAGVGAIVVANRTLTRARELADQLGAREILFADMPEQLAKSDIVISSTASQLPVLGKGTMESALAARKRRPMFMVDLAVPRDIEPEVASLRDVYLYSVDDLQGIIDDNRQLRVAEVDKAGDIIAAGIEEFERQQRTRGSQDLLVAYRESMEQLRDAELQRALAALRAGQSPEQVLEQMARGLSKKLIHRPTLAIRRAAERGDAELLEALRTLLDSDD